MYPKAYTWRQSQPGQKRLPFPPPGHSCPHSRGDNPGLPHGIKIPRPPSGEDHMASLFSCPLSPDSKLLESKTYFYFEKTLFF